jgi:rhodanese-related sulfurtransferase
VTFFTEYTNLALLAAMVVAGALLLWPTVMRRGRGVSAQDAVLLINRRNAVVIDVRSAAQYAEGHLPQARHMELEQIQAKANLGLKNKNTPVLLVCETGQAAPKAEAILLKAGHAEVFTLAGGLAGWRRAGMPLVKQPAVGGVK